MGVTGLRIGLFGGSFNPPHQGHRHVADMARKLLGLDQVWWLVSLKNPLKPAHIIDEFSERVAEVRIMAHRSTDRVLTIERDLGTGVTAQVLDALLPALHDQRVVWIMGADSFANFHHWSCTDEIMHSIAVAVVARPGYARAAMAAPVAKRYATARIHPDFPRSLVDSTPPAWLPLTMRWNPASSTALRAKSD